MITDFFSSTTPWSLIDLFLWICWNWLFSRSPFISALRAAHLRLSGNTATPTCSALNYWLAFSPCQLQGQIDWHVSGGVHRIDHPCVEGRRIYSSIEQTLPACSCVRYDWHVFVPTDGVGNKTTLSLSLVRPSTSFIKGDALSPKKDGSFRLSLC